LIITTPDDQVCEKTVTGLTGGGFFIGFFK